MLVTVRGERVNSWPGGIFWYFTSVGLVEFFGILPPSFSSGFSNNLHPPPHSNSPTLLPASLFEPSIYMTF